MTNKTVIALLAAGVMAAASAGTAAARVPIQSGAATVIDLSAQQNKDKKKDKGQQQQKKNPAVQNKGALGAPSQKKVGGSKSGGQKQKSVGQQQKQLGGSKSGGQKQKIGGQNGQAPQQIGGSKGGNKQGGSPGKNGLNKNVKVYKPKGGKNYNTVTAKKLHGLPPGSSKAYVHGRNYSAWRGNGYRVRYRDNWRTFIPLSALAVLLVGPRHYYPYAYISAPEIYCIGRTEDGCLLNWEEVETIEGDLIGQCVAYCPWREY